ncbi:MAG: hypothetical protein ACREBG_24280 [Pyrinomonadaceae bacterium]
MYQMRFTILVVSMLMFFCGSVSAQRSGPEFRRPLACEPFEPRTKLEAIELRYERVLIKGFSQISNLNVRGGDLRVDAIELKDSADSSRATGIVIALRQAGERPHEDRSFIDYEEINSFVKALETIGRVNETVTKLPGFEARYRTAGDLDVNVFRQSRSGTAVSVTSGICDKVTVLMTLEELERLRGIILEAKARLDDIK